jgi:hypothetical protein
MSRTNLTNLRDQLTKCLGIIITGNPVRLDYPTDSTAMEEHQLSIRLLVKSYRFHHSPAQASPVTAMHINMAAVKTVGTVVAMPCAPCL